MPATAYKYLSDGRGDGVVVNRSGESIGFYGVTPVAQAGTFAAVSTTASTSSSPVGYATTTQADAIVTAVNSMRTALRNLGIVA